METLLTRVITIVALACLLVVGAVVTSILGSDSLPIPQIPMPRLMAAVEPVGSAPVSNREGKTDRLRVVTLASAAFEPVDVKVQPQPDAPNPELAASLRRAYASTSPADVGLPKLNDPVATASLPPPPKPKAAAIKPPPQKNYALLSDAQIAGIKERLKLSPSQESYWPAVETALRGVARKIHATKQTEANAGMPIDPDCDEVQQLKSAAMPLLFQLREDQKREVRQLARIIGLEKVASMI